MSKIVDNLNEDLDCICAFYDSPVEKPNLGHDVSSDRIETLHSRLTSAALLYLQGGWSPALSTAWPKDSTSTLSALRPWWTARPAAMTHRTSASTGNARYSRTQIFEESKYNLATAHSHWRAPDLHLFHWGIWGMARLWLNRECEVWPTFLLHRANENQIQDTSHRCISSLTFTHAFLELLHELPFYYLHDQAI